MGFAGLTLGLTTFMWSNMMLLFPLLGLWLLFHKKAPFSQIKSLILFILGFLLVIAPMTIRYHTVSGKFIPVSTYNGLDFHLGTDTPTNGIAPVLQDVKEQPGKFLLLNLKKTALFFHSYEFADTRDLYFNRSYSIILSSLLWKWGINFPLGVLFPFAFLGIYYMFRNRTSGRGTILIFILGTALSVVILYVCSRFRAPAMPFIIILAGGGVVNAFRGLEGKKTVLNLSIIIPLLILTNIDVLGLQRDISDQEYFNLGWKHLEAGQFQEAYDSFQKSYRANPKYTPALNQLGLILEISRDFRGAAFYYRRALSLNPDDPIAYYNLGAVEGKAGNLDTALVELNKAVVLKPDLWQAYVNLGNVYFNKKEFAIAEESYYKALRLVPDNPDIFYNLANLYLFTGDTTKAIENYERVAELSPDYPTVQEMLTKLTSGGK
jgi:Flp pilus assembly protein TadD